MDLYAYYHIYLEELCRNKTKAHFRIFVETVYVVLILADRVRRIVFFTNNGSNETSQRTPVSHSPRNNSLSHLLSVSHFVEQLLVTFLISRVTSPKGTTRYRQRLFSFSFSSGNRCAVVTDAVTGNEELRRAEGGRGGKEARFPIQWRWLSATLSTFGEIITRFAERRSLSRKKLPISNLDRPAWSRHSCIYPARFFSLLFPVPPFVQKNGPLVAAHNLFLYFFFRSRVLIQLFNRAITRDNGGKSRTSMIHKTPPAAVIDSIIISLRMFR